MRSPLQALSVALVAASLFALTSAASAEKIDVPSWVPPQYAKFFHRRTDTRPAWKRALNYLNVTVGDTGPSFALIAGVSSYPHIGGNDGDLWPARIDVEKMAAYLAGEPESFNEIVVLLDDDMTAENLRYFLTRYFPRRLADTKRSRFLFAYSGHGMTDENGHGYILTSEATSLTDWYNGISLQDVRTEVQQVVNRGHQVLALINSCYGIEFHKLSFSFGGAADIPIPTREGAHAITAGGSGERTWHDDGFGIGTGKKGSIFFEAVFAALDGRADKLPTDGIVTIGELETYLKGTVSQFTDENQNPTASDLLPAKSPGGFFFLDHNRQIEKGNARPLEGQWWGTGLAFGAPAADMTEPTVPSTDNSAEQPVVAAVEPGPPETGLSALVGRWAGTMQEPGMIFTDAPTIELEVTAECAPNKPCGTIAVPHVPCRGRITLIDSRPEGFEFNVDDFDATSDKDTCQPGAGEVFKALPDGTLSYTATYSGAVGILRRTN